MQVPDGAVHVQEGDVHVAHDVLGVVWEQLLHHHVVLASPHSRARRHAASRGNALATLAQTHLEARKCLCRHACILSVPVPCASDRRRDAFKHCSSSCARAMHGAAWCGAPCVRAPTHTFRACGSLTIIITCLMLCLLHLHVCTHGSRRGYDTAPVSARGGVASKHVASPLASPAPCFPRRACTVGILRAETQGTRGP